MKRFAAYLRISTNKGGGLDSNGIESQRQGVARYVASVGGELVRCFEEVESGRRCDRPALAQCLAFAKANMLTVLILKWDRLGRDAAFLLKLIAGQVPFIAVDCPQADFLSIGIMAVMAQHEARLISERTKAGMKIAALRGAKIGNQNPAHAIRMAHSAIQTRKRAFNEEILNAIAEIRETGVSNYTKISECLNRRGYVGRRGGAWTPAAVRRLLIENGQAPVYLRPQEPNMELGEK